MGEIKRDVEFIIREDKGIVVCKLWNCADIAFKRISKHRNLGFLDVYKYAIDDVFVGVARCAPEDKFNVEYGKKLALTRAKAKRGRAINKTIERYIKEHQKVLNRLASEEIHKVPDEKDIN